MKTGDEAAHSAAHHTRPAVISSSTSPGEEEVECSKCHMYFGLRVTIEAHERRHASHPDDELYKFQQPKDYTMEIKPAEGQRPDQYRKQKGLEVAVKKIDPEEPATGENPQSQPDHVDVKEDSIAEEPKPLSGTTVLQEDTGTNA